MFAGHRCTWPASAPLQLSPRCTPSERRISAQAEIGWESALLRVFVFTTRCFRPTDAHSQLHPRRPNPLRTPSLPVPRSAVPPQSALHRMLPKTFHQYERQGPVGTLMMELGGAGLFAERRRSSPRHRSRTHLLAGPAVRARKSICVLISHEGWRTMPTLRRRHRWNFAIY